MRKPSSLRAAMLAACALLAGQMAAASARHIVVNGHAGTALSVTVRARQVRKKFSAYGEIEPIALSTVRAVEAGVIEKLVLPGENVKAGQALAIIGGIEAQSLLERERSALRAAAITLSADRLKQKSHLVTRQQVAMAEAAYQAARGRLRVARATLTLRAPVSGEVQRVDVSDGERVVAGQRLLVLQTGRLWLKARYYGKDGLAIHPGMTGWFDPVSGAPIAVRVQTIAPALSADGGEAVMLEPAQTHHRSPGSAALWRSGVWGKVKLEGPVERMVVVPSRALVLDRGRWWVMVVTQAGEHRQQVLPGPTRGWMTLIAQGLVPGTRILVQNAYLAFHRDIAQRYTPPD